MYPSTPPKVFPLKTGLLQRDAAETFYFESGSLSTSIMTPRLPRLPAGGVAGGTHPPNLTRLPPLKSFPLLLKKWTKATMDGGAAAGAPRTSCDHPAASCPPGRAEHGAGASPNFLAAGLPSDRCDSEVFTSEGEGTGGGVFTPLSHPGLFSLLGVEVVILCWPSSKKNK